ncbi:MAG: hypothetical protein U0935_15040 [Pirellulales bacterium]
MKWTGMSSRLACLVGVLLIGGAQTSVRLGAEEPQETPLQVSPELEDKDFEKYAGAAELAAAGADFDPQTLADLADKLSAGERALSRPPAHGVTSDEAFKLAIQAALARRDGKALEALEAKLRSLKKLDLANRAAAVRKLLAAKRDAAPVLTVTVDELLTLPPDVLADFQATVQDVRTAQVAGNRQALAAAKAHVQDENGWLAKQKEFASKLIASIESELPEETDAALAAVAGKLASASRFFPAPSGPPAGAVTTRNFTFTLLNGLRAQVTFTVVAGNKTTKPVVSPGRQLNVTVPVAVDARTGQWKHPVVVSAANVSGSQTTYSPARFAVQPGPTGQPRLVRLQ